MTTRQPEDGFAIVEVLFAIIIVTVLAVGVLGGERSGFAAARDGIEETAAMGVLQERAETVRRDAGTLQPGTRTVDAHRDITVLRGLSVEETARIVEPGLFEVEIVLRWQRSASQNPVERRLTTWVAVEEGR